MQDGSELSNQYGLITPKFNIYPIYTIRKDAITKNCNQIHVQYPLFPFKVTKGIFCQYIIDLKDDQKFI